MIFAVGLTALYLMGLAVSGLDPLMGQTVFALGQAGLALVLLAVPATRRAMLNAAIAFWPAGLAFIGLVGLTAWQAGLVGSGAAEPFNAYAARSEVWSLAALPFGALAVAGIAGAVGRRPLHNALLLGVLVFAVLDVAEKLQSSGDRPFLATAGETGAVYALLAILAAFVAFDEARSGPPGVGAQLSRRVVLPAAAFLSAVLGLALSGSLLTLAALAAGLAALSLGFSPRDWRRPIGFALLGMTIFFAFGAAATGLAMGAAEDPLGFTGVEQCILTGLKGATGLGAGVDGGVLQAWPVQAGPTGAALLVAVAALICVRLALAVDRRRTPSRGFALALGVLAAIVFAGPGGTGAAATVTLALLLGLAFSYSDRLRAKAQQSARGESPLALEGLDREPDLAGEPIADAP